MVAEINKPNFLSLDWLVSHTRWVWLILLAIYITAESFLSSEPSGNIFLSLIVLLVGFILNGIYAGLLWAEKFPSWLAITATILDAILAVIFLYLLREYTQLLLPLMIFPVILTSVRWNTESGLGVAFFVVLGYSLPLIEVLRSNVERPVLIETLLIIGSAALTLFVAGALPGLLARMRISMIEGAESTELNRLRLAHEQDKLISEMARTMSSTLNYRKVLRTMMDLAYSALAKTGIKEGERLAGMILLFEGDEEENIQEVEDRLTVTVVRNLPRRDEGRKVNTDVGLISQAINTAEVVVSQEGHKDKILTTFASETSCHSAICAPLRAGFDTYGVVLFFTSRPNFFGEGHKSLLSTFCSQAIISLQNAQLFEDLHLEQQRILEKEAEARRKLARDLHDGPTQSIAAIAMRLNFIKLVIKKKDMAKAYDEIIKVEDIAQKTTHEIRTMLFTMRPVILETQGLVVALEQFAERLRADGAFNRVIVQNRGYDGQLSTESEGVIFAIIEEAVGNAKKHSQASEMRITMAAQQSVLYVEARDNGVGFDVDATKSTYDQRTSLGLINMDERAQAIGGHCTIESKSGQGTSVRVQVPLE